MTVRSPFAPLVLLVAGALSLPLSLRPATADDAAESADRPPAAAPTPTEALSIFGVPLGAKPYASGGLP